jgi:TRAP-type C4-dicarboxylate transport system permease small subunit
MNDMFAGPVGEHQPGKAARLLFVSLPRWIMGGALIAGLAINLANVIGRYAFGFSLHWAEEVLVYLMIWGVFIGVAAVAYKGEHLNMDLFSSSMGRPWSTIINACMVLILLLCCGFAISQSWKVVSLFVQAGQVSVAAGIPKAIPHAALLVGFSLMLLAVLARIRSYLTGKF